jgi:serine/threonine protein kinase
MTPAADDDKTAFTPRPGSGFEPTNFAPTAPVERTELMPPPAAKLPELGNVLPVGTRIAEFEITSLLGEGGFGIVYLCNDTSLGRRVALKEYMPTSLAARTANGVQVKSERHRETFEAGRKSFVNEARLLAQFDHASLVKVYRFWEANGTAYMVMPFYEGKNLRDTLRENIAATAQPPDEAWLRTLLVPLTEALRVIHAEQCYHRDIAPDNVMMLAGSQRPLLLDFGAARRVIGDMTQALTVILKPGYAPIEQYAEVPGMRQGPWTDVYALAAVVYFAITGKTPPVSVGRMLSDNYQPLAQVAAGRYSAQFLEAVDRALVVRPEQRTPSIEAFRDDLGLLEHHYTGMGGGGATQMRPPADDVTRIAPSTYRQAPGGAPTQMRTPPQPQPLTGRMPPPGGNPTRMAPTPPTSMPDEPTRIAAPRQPSSGAPTQQRSGGRVLPPDTSEGSGRRGLVLGLSGLAVVALGIGGYAAFRPKPGTTTTGGAPPPPVETPTAPTPPPPVTTTTGGPVAQPPPPPPPQPFNAVREFDKAVQAQSAAFGVRASATKTTLRVGTDEFRFSVNSERAGHLYILGIGPDGALAQLVPNKRLGEVQLRAGQTWQFPAKTNRGDFFTLVATEPLGASHLLVVVSAERRNFAAMRPQAEGDINLFAGGDAATAAVAAHAGAGSVVVGRAACPGGAACDDSYGAAVLKFDVVR